MCWCLVHLSHWSRGCNQGFHTPSVFWLATAVVQQGFVYQLIYISDFSLFSSEWHGGQRGAAITGQAWMVFSGQLATPPRAAQDHDRETRAQGKPVSRICKKPGQTDGWISLWSCLEFLAEAGLQVVSRRFTGVWGRGGTWLLAGMWTERLCASKLLLADKISLIFYLFFFFLLFFAGYIRELSVAKARFIFSSVLWHLFQNDERIPRENRETFYITLPVSEYR